MIDYKELIKNTLVTRTKNTITNTTTKTIDYAVKKTTRVIKSKLGYTISITEDYEIRKVNTLLKRLDPVKFKENSITKTSTRTFASQRNEALTTATNYTIKVPNCKAFMNIQTKFSSQLDIFIFGPDAKAIKNLFILYLDRDESITCNIKKLETQSCKVYTIDVDTEDDEVYIRGGSKSPAKSLESIYTDESNKEKITNYLAKWKQSSALFKDLNISYKLGILLYGPPGTGKTSMSKAISCMLGFDIYAINMNKFKSSSIPQVREMAERNKGMIILLEDIDYIFGKRETEFTQEEKARSNALLQLLDGADSMPNVVFIATTNNLSSLDKAITRDGRFDLKIEMNNISKEIAEQMCSGLYLTQEQTTSILSNETFPINPSYLQNKIIQYIFSHIEDMDYKPKGGEGGGIYDSDDDDEY